MTEEFEEDIFEDDELYHYGTPQLYPGDPHGSGRYREGSGDNPNQHGCDDFIERFTSLRKQGLSEKEIAQALGLSTTQLRIRKSVEIAQRRSELAARAEQLAKQGVSATEGARIMGLRGESSFRSLLNTESKARMKIAEKTAANLAKLVDERGMIDVGEGVEKQLGMSRGKLDAALKILKNEGYEVYGGRVPQVTNPGRQTTIQILCPPGTEHKDIYDYSKIHSVKDITSRDDGDTFEPSFRYPESMSSSRLAIRYAEDGGAERDGQIEIRRGVKDLYMGDGVNYAQVRILVDGTHYIKGMAIYSDDLPEGVDVMFNSNKSHSKYGDNKLAYLKDITDNIGKDPDNPFGSAIKENGGQLYYDDPNGKYTDPVTGHKQSLGLINKRAEEGDWYSWKDKVPSQFLSKQPKPLIERQLKETLAERQQEYDEIMNLVNPTIKRSLLESFADDCDSSAVDLKATAFPNQKYQVIMPLKDIKDNEVYAPNFKDGSTVALVRFPHGGTFEIPILTVNNRNEEGIKNLTSTPQDAIGINSSVAERLSGADFDGDTVMVIPLNDRIKVKSTEQLKGLKHFDTKLEYGPDEEPRIDEHGVKHYYRGGKEFKPMSETQKTLEMGRISNLITDMTLQGAKSDELERAVKHSMVVIDAVKHHLDFNQSEKDNGIKALHDKYQGYLNPKTGKHVGGASTLISRSTSEIDIPERKEGAYFTKDTKEPVTKNVEENRYYITKTGKPVPDSNIKMYYVNPLTGEKAYRNTNRKYYTTEYINSKGKKVKANVITKDGKKLYKGEDGLYKEITDEPLYEHLAMQKIMQMANTSNAYSLSKGSIPEQIYAEYANKLKTLANHSRLNAMQIKDVEYSVVSRKAFKDEYNSLKAKLDEAIANAPKERQAQMIANTAVAAKKANADRALTAEEENKIRQQAISRARKQVGAKRKTIEITPNEWKAIQAGAITKTMLQNIIKHVDSTTLKQLAMPRTSVTLSPAKVSRLKGMSDRGYTTNEIAQALGVSTSTVVKYLKGE
jgi:biotin operon repressor/DNA-binding CsgD family transcriptional regulator